MNIMTSLGINEYIFLPNKRKLGFLGPYDLMSDEEIFRMIENDRLQKVIEDRQILGIATREDAIEFLKVPIGRKIIQAIVNKSSGKDLINLEDNIKKVFPEVYRSL